MRGGDGGPPPRGCLDNIRNRGQGLFRLRGFCFLHQSLPLGAGRRKGLDVAEPGPAGAAQTPPPCPPLEPWHPTHPAPAIPRPNIPLRSGSACRRPLQYQVSVCSPASDAGSAPPALAQATGPVCGGCPCACTPLG